MALIDCPECGGQVSTQADKCPHCGAPPPDPEQAVREALRQAAKDTEAERMGRDLRKPAKKKPWHSGLIPVLTVFGAILALVWMASGKDNARTPAAATTSTPTQRQTPTRPATPSKTKTVAQELREYHWTDATEDEYREYCRNGRCKLQTVFVLGVERYKGNVFVTLGDVANEKRFDAQLRNPKTAKLYGQNFAATVTCQPPYAHIKDPATELYFRNCRHNPRAPPYDIDAEMAEQNERMANRSEFSFTVEGYDGSMLYGYRKALGTTTNFAIKLNNARTSVQLPPGWTVYVVCFDEMQLYNTQIGTLRKHSDCNQLRGERP